MAPSMHATPDRHPAIQFARSLATLKSGTMAEITPKAVQFLDEKDAQDHVDTGLDPIGRRTCRGKKSRAMVSGFSDVIRLSSVGLHARPGPGTVHHP